MSRKNKHGGPYLGAAQRDESDEANEQKVGDPGTKPKAPERSEPTAPTQPRAASPSPDPPVSTTQKEPTERPDKSEETKLAPAGKVRCRVVGPGSVKSGGRWHPEGSEGLFDSSDADTLPQLERL